MINILDKNTKLILAEPIDEAIEEVETEVVDTPSEDEILPDVTLDEPATISTETEPEISSEVKDNAISTLINSGITTELNSIDDIKSYIATIEAEQPELTEVIEILKTISDEKTIIIGMYNTILDIIDPEHAELIKTGETKATEISDTEISEPSEEETETED